MTLSHDERIERYLSIEWTVAEESASNATKFAKLLVAALEEATKALKAAHEEGDLHTFSSLFTALIEVLRAVGTKVEQIETDSYAHYVELLGGREDVLAMARALDAYFNDPEGAQGALAGFDDILQSFGGGDPELN